MERDLQSRRPPNQEHHGLSNISMVFFGVDICQVVMVVLFQSLMIALGNFNAYNSSEDPGMGPGRRIYMGLFMGAVVYTCFLCLFAVKQQNFMEVLAFLLQNFGFVTYGLIQGTIWAKVNKLHRKFVVVYHVGYKENNANGSNVTTQHNSLLRNVALTNSLLLFLLNGVFIFLSWKLYSEFGWKIYKRVRFNIRLRSFYHFYQLLSCLLKMEILYWWMYAICNSLVLLRDTGKVLYYVNLAFVPLSMVYAGLGYIATQREIRLLMILYLFWTFGGAGYFVYKIYGFLTDTCTGCHEFHQTGKDIHDEARLHFIYLSSLNLALLSAIFGVAYKVFSNFGQGLEGHFNPTVIGRPRTATDLNLRRVSRYIEESVFSVTSYDSEYDEFSESMTLERGDTNVMSTSKIPLLQDTLSPDFGTRKASSMPNLAEIPSRPVDPTFQDNISRGLDDLLQPKDGLVNRSKNILEVIVEDADNTGKDGDPTVFATTLKVNVEPGSQNRHEDKWKNGSTGRALGGDGGEKDLKELETNAKLKFECKAAITKEKCKHTGPGRLGGKLGTKDATAGGAICPCNSPCEGGDDVFKDPIPQRDSGCLDCQISCDSRTDRGYKERFERRFNDTSPKRSKSESDFRRCEVVNSTGGSTSSGTCSEQSPTGFEKPSRKFGQAEQIGEFPLGSDVQKLPQDLLLCAENDNVGESVTRYLEGFDRVSVL